MQNSLKWPGFLGDNHTRMDVGGLPTCSRGNWLINPASGGLRFGNGCELTPLNINFICVSINPSWMEIFEHSHLSVLIKRGYLNYFNCLVTRVFFIKVHHLTHLFPFVSSFPF